MQGPLLLAHVLEHLSLGDCDRALANSASYLLPGGTFRIVLPDLATYVQEYLDDPSEDAASNFMSASSLGREQRSHTVSDFLKDWIGNSAHLWMWDERSLTARLRKHGFVDIRRAAFGDADDPKFAEVENISRFDGFLAMECRK